MSSTQDVRLDDLESVHRMRVEPVLQGGNQACLTFDPCASVSIRGHYGRCDSLCKPPGRLSAPGKVRIIRAMTRSRSLYSNKKSPSRPVCRPWLGWLFKLSLVGLVLLAGFAVYPGCRGAGKFSGKRWTVPAKVYARPLSCSLGRS